MGISREKSSFPVFPEVQKVQEIANPIFRKYILIILDFVKTLFEIFVGLIVTLQINYIHINCLFCHYEK